MEIDPLSGPAPRNRVSPSSPRRSAERPAPDVDTFAGPPTGEFLKKIAALDGTRPELIESAKGEIAAGTFLTEHRIQKVVESLLQHL